MTLRVTGGDLRGRKLETPPGGATRPTASRVREAMFSMLGPLHGARVLDLCCGCGSLGIEAVSRGAASAILVDDAAPAAQAARANVRSFDIEDDVQVLELDAIRAAARLAADGQQFDLVLVDAPYSQAPRLVRALDDHIAGLLAPGGRVVLEGDRRDPPALSLTLDRERTYRDVLVRIYDAPVGSDDGPAAERDASAP